MCCITVRGRFAVTLSNRSRNSFEYSLMPLPPLGIIVGVTVKKLELMLH